jgi:hypothetical protein
LPAPREQRAEGKVELLSLINEIRALFVAALVRVLTLLASHASKLDGIRIFILGSFAVSERERLIVGC